MVCFESCPVFRGRGSALDRSAARVFEPQRLVYVRRTLATIRGVLVPHRLSPPQLRGCSLLSGTLQPNHAPEPTATVPAVSIMFVFIVCPFGCVSPARGRGSALDR